MDRPEIQSALEVLATLAALGMIVFGALDGAWLTVTWAALTIVWVFQAHRWRTEAQS